MISNEKTESAWIDISRAINPEMASYPGNPEVVLTQVRAATPEASALTKISLGSHTGTHIDAPAHITDGAVGTGTYTLEQLCGYCQVVDVTHISSAITAKDLPSIHSSRVVFKTKNSAGDPTVFDESFVALTEDAAQLLVDQEVQLVGIDALSIKKKGVKDNTHRILLDAGVVIVEGLWLATVTPGDYELVCLPLSVDLDGAPTRAIIRPLFS